MQIIRDLDVAHHPAEGTVATIGAYDGVHLGHRAVIDTVRSLAAAGGHRSAVVTFDRHPAQVVRPESAPRLLTDLEQRLELLGSTGVDETVLVPFDLDRSTEPAEDFVERVLVELLNVRGVVVGEDFHFGHRRRGDVQLLEEMGRTHGFEVHGLTLVAPDGHPARDDEQVSSTAIRRALHEGRLDAANAMLGRPHEMRGPVVPGDRRGRTIGFPTANVAVDDDLLMPADGIYAGHLVLDPGDAEVALPAAVYIGKRPTFYDDRAMTLLEVHVLDHDEDLYGRRVGVRFVERLRADRRFDSVEALAAQLQVDCDDARAVLGA